MNNFYMWRHTNSCCKTTWHCLLLVEFKRISIEEWWLWFVMPKVNLGWNTG